MQKGWNLCKFLLMPAVFAILLMLWGCGAAAEERVISGYAYSYDPAIFEVTPEPTPTPEPAPDMRMAIDDRTWFSLTVPLAWVMEESDASHVLYQAAENPECAAMAFVQQFPGAERMLAVELLRSAAVRLWGSGTADHWTVAVWQNVPTLSYVDDGSETRMTHRLYHVREDTLVCLTTSEPKTGDAAVAERMEGIRKAFLVKPAFGGFQEGAVADCGGTDLWSGITRVTVAGIEVKLGVPLAKSALAGCHVFDETEAIDPGKTGIVHMASGKDSFFACLRNDGQKAAMPKNCTLYGVEIFDGFCHDGDGLDAFSIGTASSEFVKHFGQPRLLSDLHVEWFLDGQTLVVYFQEDKATSLMLLALTESEQNARRDEYEERRKAAESAAAASDILNQLPTG